MSTEHLKQQRLVQKITTYMDVAERIGSLSTSSRLKVGALAIRIDLSKIAAIGYNGNYPGAPVNPITGTEEESLEQGRDGYLHAEENVLVAFREPDPQNYIILLTHSPCRMCSKRIVRGGFRCVYWRTEYRVTSHIEEILINSSVMCGDEEQLIRDYHQIVARYNQVIK